MAIEVLKKPYREELVREIKEAGLEIIDRADELVPKDLHLITGFSIHINFNQGDCVPKRFVQIQRKDFAKKIERSIHV